MFEDYYMPQFDMDYFNSPAFQQAIAAAVQQYSPQPVEPVYYAPEPVYYAPARGIGRRGEYVDDIYDVQPAEEVYVNQGPSAEEIAAAQAEAQRVAAEQEYFARVEAERVAAERAAAAEAAAQRQQTELNERRAQAAQAAAERAAQERALAEQAAAQAAAEAQAAAQAQAQAAAQARAQAQAAAQAEAQRVAAAQAQAQAQAQAAAQAEAQRVAAEQQLAQRVEAERIAEFRAAELERQAARMQTEAAERRAVEARVAAERAAAERAAAEQAAAQAEAQRVAAAQAEAQRVEAARVQAEAQAAAQAQAQAQAQAEAKAQADAQAAQRVAELQAAAQAEARRVAAAQVQAEAQRIAAEQAAAERAASERAAAEQAAAQAEAQRAAAAQEASAKAEAERVALARAQELEAAAERTNNEVAAARAEQARIAAERATAEREAAEQASIQAEVAAQEQARVQAEAAAAVTPAPEPVFTPEPQLLSGIGRAVDENYYVPEVQAPEQTYTPAPVAAPETDIVRGIGGREVSAEPDYGFAPEQIYVPEPVPVYAPPSAPAYYEPAPVAGIGREVNYNDSEQVLSPEPVYTPAAEPMTIEAEPVAGIGSTAAAAPVEAPSVIETAAPAPAAGGPLTQEQYDAMADRRAAANAPPRGTYIAAPTGGRGEDTGFETPGQQSNSFQYRGGPVRVVDGKGNVLFSGEGPEGAVAAARFAQNLSDTKGSDATWDLQEGERTINPDGSVGPIRYVSGPSTRAKGMGTIGDLAAFVLPIAAAIAAGPLGLAAQVAMGAAAGGLGAVMSGNDPLKAALIAGASAGIMNVSGANQAISGTLDKIGGVIAGEALEEGAKKAGEKLAEQIVVTGLSRAAQGAGSAIGNTLLSEGVKAGIGDITGYQTPAEKFAEQPLPETLQPPVQPPVDEIVVTAAPRPDAVADVISGIGSSTAADVIPSFETPADRFVQEPPAEILTEAPAEETIVVTGERIPDVADAVTGAVAGIGDSILTPDDLSVLDRVSDMEKEVEEPYEEIVVTGSDTAIPIVTPDIGIGGGSVTETLPELTPDPALTEKSTLDKIIDAAEVAGNVIPIVGGVIGGSGGGGGTIAPDTSKINFTKTTLRPTIPVGGIGGAGGYPYTPQTYGRRGGDQETEYLFFTKDPVTGQELLQSAPAPITTPIVNEPAGPAMILPSGNTFAEGGEVDDDMVKHLVDYHKNGGHQGPGRVKGIGSGQDDKIPAWLSDGEYVWSAQDVADLGDGSTDEGVRRLDKMRQMVRRQAGRKDVKKIAKPQKGIDTMLKAVGGLA